MTAAKKTSYYKSLDNPRFLFFAGCVIGALLFVLTYGLRVLDFSYDAWILRVRDVDIHQHYLGWCHFRNAPWRFPLGIIDSLSYPHGMSILWTDSIPLFAFAFKCFRGILPETFQYFGLYGILSFSLTGGTAALFIKRLTDSGAAAIISVPFFSLSFPMLQRMFYHTSLTAHYLIIIPLLFLVYDCYKWSIAKKCLIWGAYFFFAVMLHPYLWAMGAIIAIVAFIRELFITKDFKPALITLTVSGIITYLALLLTGAFYGSVNAAYKLGGYEANLNTFINPLSLGRFLKELPLQNANQYEGYAYLGLGGLMLIAAAIIASIIPLFKKEALNNSFTKTSVSTYLTALCLIFLIISIFPDITLNTRLLFGIRVPEWLERIIGIFRSNGRFIWPAVILIYSAAIKKLSQLKPTYATALLLLCLVIQFADLSSAIAAKHEKFTANKKIWHSDLENEALYPVSGKYKHIVLVTDDSYRMERCAYFAAKNNMTVNRFYFARNIDDAVNETLSGYHRQCAEGNAPDDVIFVFDEPTMEEWKKDTALHFYDLTGTIVGLKDEIALPEI